MHNLDEEEPEGGAIYPGGTSLLQDQGEEPYHTGFVPVCIPVLEVEMTKTV